MKKYLLFISCIATCWFYSCIEDKTDPGNRKISYIEFTELPDTNVFDIDKLETFVFEAPPFRQQNQEKAVEYSWEVNYREVGNEKILQYTGDELGAFDARLKVSNEDGAAFYRFTLRVNSPYERGLLILSKHEEETLLSFKRLDKENVATFTDAYLPNNPAVTLGKEPVSITQKGDYVYLATNNPTKAVKLNDRTFQVTHIINYPGEVNGGVAPNPVNNTVVFTGNGTCYEYDTQQNAFMAFITRMIPENSILADKAVFSRPTSSRVYLYLFDNHVGRLYRYYSEMMTTISDATFNGKELKEMLACDEGKNMIGIFKDKASGEYSMAYYNAVRSSMTFHKTIAPAGIVESSVFAVSQYATILYYSVGNKIYRYNFLADNFPETFDYTVGENGMTIRSMVLSADEKTLYVAADGGSGALKGSLFAFDTETKSELWNEKGVTGEIVQMIYKE